MDANFWIKAWEEGRTAFHQEHYHDKLLQYFPALSPKKEQKVLVPLCGKTKDLLWLQGLNLQVHGVELHEKAVEAFFAENNLSPVQRTVEKNFIQYSYKNITISVGDFFKFGTEDSYDLVYDRASLVALPHQMRKNYAERIQKLLKPSGKCLLIAYEYDQTKMDGPPFSVDTNEIHALYQEQFKIELMESMDATKEGVRLSSVAGLQQKIYILEKKN